MHAGVCMCAHRYCSRKTEMEESERKLEEEEEEEEEEMTTEMCPANVVVFNSQKHLRRWIFHTKLWLQVLLNLTL